MKIKIIQKPVIFFQVSKIVEKMSKYRMSKYRVRTRLKSRVIERAFILVPVRTKVVAIIGSDNFSKDTLSSSMLEIDKKMVVQPRYGFSDNGENK